VDFDTSHVLGEIKQIEVDNHYFYVSYQQNELDVVLSGG
jgi:hypothetical protein